MTLWLWLDLLDLLAWLGLDGTRPYLWVLRRASDATDWGQEEECEQGKEPF
jgi:hypothetical protein